jgi:hypothetical protein
MKSIGFTVLLLLGGISIGPRTAAAICGNGIVDADEQCDLGPGNGSPTNCCTTLCEFRAEDNVCRPAANACDVAEHCSGTSDTCPPDLVIPEGAHCNDGSPCTMDDRCSQGTCTGTPSPDTCLDDFTCYRARTTPGTARDAPITSLHHADQFEDSNFRVLRARLLCTPSNKNGEGTLDAVTHGKSYLIRPAAGSPRHLPQTNVKVTNQLGSIRVDTVKADLLFIPTAKSLASEPPPLDPASHRVDHYKCYKVRVTHGTPKFPKTVTVSYTDQFTSPARTLRLKKPRHLCVPVDKNGEGIKNPPIHLMCYVAGGSPGAQKRKGLFVNNQFGPERLDTLKDGEFCVPSVKELSSTVTTTTQPGGTTTTTAIGTTTTTTGIATTTTTLATEGCGTSLPQCDGSCPGGSVCSFVFGPSGGCTCVTGAAACSPGSGTCSGSAACPTGTGCQVNLQDPPGGCACFPTP